MPLPIKAVIFDWGDTLMRDHPEKPGPMYQWDVVSVMEGAEFLLPYLSKKYLLAVATNAGCSNTEAMVSALQRVEIADYFSRFWSSIDLGVAKPDPRFFLSICNQLGIEPGQCVMVGNSYEKDIVGACRAGLQTILYNPDNFPGPFPMAGHVVVNLTDIIDIL
jgi:putative hydrolase of the HAD superfamily